MNSLLLKNVVLGGKNVDVLIVDGCFRSIAGRIDVPAEKVIDGGGHLALCAPFFNAHVHAAMTLLRGYADDMELFTWLQEYIWPIEAKLTGEDVYWGTRLAILEMIHSGTVFFADMYWHHDEVIRAVEDTGIRAAVGLLFICADGKLLERNEHANRELLARRDSLSDRILVTYAPHAIYTVAEPVLRDVAEEAAQNNLPIHIHVSETAREVEECRAAHGGMTPIAYLDSLGLLGPRTVLAHCVHLTDGDIELIQERRAVIAHMPCSNMKLCSGRFRYHDAVERGGCRIAIGTDGASSNNNLSMLEEVKFAALSAKIESNLPTAGKASDLFAAATRGGAEAYGIDSGVIAEGKPADAMLVELNHPRMIGDYHLEANLVYSADSSCIDTVICAGRVLMEHGRIDGENEVLDAARRCCRRLARA